MIRMRTWNAASLLAALILVPAPLRAQMTSSAPGSPEATASAFFAAMEGKRWEAAARMVHPDALQRNREWLLSGAQARRDAEPMEITPEFLMREEPGMPREVAEYQARRANEMSARHGNWALEQAGVRSVEELEALSAEEMFARFLAAADPDQQVRASIDEEADSLTAEVLLRAMPRTRRTVVGAVPASDGAYVLYASGYGGPAARGAVPERVAVIHLRRHAGEWMIDPGESRGHDLFGGPSMAYDVIFDPAARLRVEEMRQPAVWPAQGAPRLRARMEGVGDDPLTNPPHTLVMERLAADGSVAARIEVPAQAWAELAKVVELWSLLMTPAEP